MNNKFPQDALAGLIYHNFLAQLANNKARIKELRRYATQGFAEVFRRVPALLNANEPDLPGYVPDQETPYGIKFVERQLWLPRSERQPNLRAAENPVIESLFLIGSSGSVGHNASSDLDYWVCFEADTFTPQTFELFQQKLAAVSRWASREHGTEANFYTVNLADLARGRLTRLDDAETEGEVAPLLLLEELYRTLLHVAGRPPFWQGVPTSLSAGHYQELSRQMTDQPEAEFVDLGFPSLPGPQEILAAALWLARKSEADPFKGILKIVALLEYVESDFTRELLCNQVKEAVFKAAPEALPVDPYILTINRVVEYGALRLTPEQLHLLRVSAVLKVLGSGASKLVFELPANSPKRDILLSWAQSWGWHEERLAHLLDYNTWPERERLHLGMELLRMLSSVYIRIAQHLIKHYPGQINPQDEELAPLAARLLARMGGLDSTIPTLPSVGLQSSFSRSFILKHNPEGQCWDLHSVSGNNGLPSPDNLVYSSERVAKIAAWLVHNQVYGPDTKIYIRTSQSNGAYLDPEILAALLESIHQVFPPFKLSHDKLPHLWSPGGHGQVLLALNLDLPPTETELKNVDFILRTGWGEMRHFIIDVSDSTSNANKYLKIVQILFKQSGPQLKPENIVFQHANSPEMRKAAMNIRGGLAAAARRSKPELEKKSRIDI